ncbi:transposase-like protein [Clostridium algifaecis]|uniref:Transposase-like protein n=1 Tax=Clostridium algifaecis TaxID=1472040 RepID=A0ABS4KV96_9CLOT|nr:helix-turn-helix domain-containing protein [Clostridium algifaecis]MBP2033963.1 transposase-like protein [Clostridium algifaecis]
MSKNKISPDEKICAVELFLDGKGSQRSIAAQLGISYQSFQQWIRNYKSMGKGIFIKKDNKKYSSDLKISSVRDHLAGIGSQDDICMKYGIRSKSKLQKWINQYNSNEEFKTSGTGETIIMTKGRKTIYEERIEIVQYCIEDKNNYAETAEKYQVSWIGYNKRKINKC